MTLGLFLPLALFLGALIVVPMTLARLRGLPGPTDPGYDAKVVRDRKLGLAVIICAWCVAPVLMYLTVNVIDPVQGAIVLF
jgi:hypothetical protein